MIYAARGAMAMLHENIRRFRKAKGLTQEEMAASLNVVRQTVSKWENGQSAPDADLLPQVAALLGVSVNQLLGDDAPEQTASLAQELKKAKEQLAEKELMETRARAAGKKRGLILFLSFLALLAAITIQDHLLSALCIGFCILAALIVFLRNLPLLSNVSATDPGFKTIKIVTFFNLVIFSAGIVLVVLSDLADFSFSERSETLLAAALVSCIMVFAGIVSPKLPFNRHTGLRLPWTVQDEDTWNIAHRILGVISLPCALLYLAAGLCLSNFELVSLCAMAVWIGIPATVSFLFFRRKFKGTSKYIL